MLRKFFAPNIQRIEGIRAIGAVLEKVFFWFGILLGGFVFFAKAITTAFHASGLNGEDKVIIVLSVDVNLRNSLIFNMRQLTMRAK